MSYPFVKANADFGRRKGPVEAFLVHFAEGGGTVGYLSRPNPNNVSVHYVIEKTGRTVQMIDESRASGSLRPTAIRTTDDPDGFYGVTVAKAVMGDWWRDPNSAVISLEIEGFARDGPNAKQAPALEALVKDVRSRYPDMGLLGHRDFASYKACPGKLIPWTILGGHGPFRNTNTEAPMLDFEILDEPGDGWVTVNDPNASAIVLKDGSLYPLTMTTRKRAYARIRLTAPFRGIADPKGYLVGKNGGLLLDANVDFVPDNGQITDCTDLADASYNAGLDAAQKLVAAAPRKGV